MSKYTITIKKLIDNNFNFGLLDYPIFDNNYRNKLNKKILNHYYMSEIGFETAELFKFYLNQKMEEIMPYYNTLYQKQNEALENIFNTINITETLDKDIIENLTMNDRNNITENNERNSSASSETYSENSSQSSSESETENNNNQQVGFQDTPQGRINFNNLENADWLTNYTKTENDGTNNSSISDETQVTSTADGSETRLETEENTTTETKNKTSQVINATDYTKSIHGNNGKSYIETLGNIRKNLMNIDLMIINELENLFFGLM